MMTDIAGILKDKDDPDSLIPLITVSKAQQLRREGVIDGGMIPKVGCCIEAIYNGVQQVIIIRRRAVHIPHPHGAFDRRGRRHYGRRRQILSRRKHMSIKSTDNQYVAHTYKRFDIAVVKGSGALCWDDNGKEYIDMTSGIGVNAFGYSDPVWAAAVAEQAKLLQHTSNLYYTAPCAELAEILCTRTGMSKVFFGNSGAEANECAVKVARKYAAETKGAEYCNIITFHQSFHGRTLTTLAATGQDSFHHLFTPLTEGFLYADAEDIDGLETLIRENKVAGVLLETIQGEGGVNAMSEFFLKAVEQLCRKHDIVFMIDEVQTGNGRTGALYSYQLYDLHPDVVTTAKGIAGGLPMGACPDEREGRGRFILRRPRLDLRRQPRLRGGCDLRAQPHGRRVFSRSAKEGRLYPHPPE